MLLGSPVEVGEALDGVDYLADRGLATAVFLALAMERPLFLEGEPGVGKTEVAHALARICGARLIRLQCHEGIDVTQAVYEWNHPRQLLHVRTREAERAAEGLGAAALDNELWSEAFLIRRPVLDALSGTAEHPVVLLIDEIDRADDEFEAALLEVLSTASVTIPELGTICATRAPIVVLTSNRTRDVHDAVKRRCIYHWLDHPDLVRETEIIRRRAPGVGEGLASRVADLGARLRQLNLVKPPGVAETIDWAIATIALGSPSGDDASMEASLGSVLKYREDFDRVAEASLFGRDGAA